MSYTLVELCCGAAALSVHVGEVYKRPLLPYHGSKWKLRRPLESLLVKRRFLGRPQQVVLNDIGPWGDVWDSLLDPERRGQIITLLEQWAEDDPREVYDRLHEHSSSEDPAEYAAEYLYLQRIAFSGKALADSTGVWKSPGFNESSAYGEEASDTFGQINPMIPSLVRTLKEYRWERTGGWSAMRGSATDVQVSFDGPLVVYLDPPYQDTTVYPGGHLDREAVLDLARLWDARGALVIISEAVPIEELGWETQCLVGSPLGDSLFRGTSTEWITFNDVHAPKVEVDVFGLLGG